MHTSQTDNALRHLDFTFFDTVVMQISFLLMHFLTRHEGFLYADGDHRMVALVFFFVQIVLGLFSDIYDKVFTRDSHREFWALLRNVFLVLVLSGAYIFLAQIPVHAEDLLVTSVIYFDLNFFVRQWNKARHLRKGLPMRKVIVIAAADHVRQAIRRIDENKTSADHELNGVILLDQAEPNRFSDLGVPIFYIYEDRLLEKLSRLWIDDAFVLAEEYMAYPKELMQSFLLMGVTIHTSLSVLDDFSFSQTAVQEFGSYKVISNSVKFVSDQSLLAKRMLDIAAGLAGTICTGIIFLFVAPLIYIKSPGPIFFAQPRIGQNGRVFRMYKFRSMYLDAEQRKRDLTEQNKIGGGLMFKMDDDPRIIGSEKKGKDGKPRGIGNFIRNTSLDEFPQFINVLKGDMSLVGTRPPTVDEWTHYHLHHRFRMSAKPGITGMWQVSGRSKITDFEQVVALDQEYIENWSIWLDLKILLKTVKVVLRHEGAS